jgi:hypothetical protein
VDDVYRADATNDWFMRGGIHVEEPFRSWNVGLERTSLSPRTTRSSLSAPMGPTTGSITSTSTARDWARGPHHDERESRPDAALVAPTIAKASLAFTVQQGELGNTWNTVPTGSGVSPEALPRWRIRPAAVIAVAQWLPWNGALKLHYRYYWDDWGIASHTAEVRLHQRFAPWIYVTAMYRRHHQRGASFFVTHLPDATDALRTADSDLDTFVSQSVGCEARVHYPWNGLRDVELSMGYERYFRSNDLDVNIYQWTTGFRF